MLLLLIVCWIAWSTPHTMIATREELASMGGAHHPFLNVLGVMSAKNTAVNIMILTTFLSFLIYRRANKKTGVPRGQDGARIQAAPFAVAAVVLLFFRVVRAPRRRDRPAAFSWVPGRR